MTTAGWSPDLSYELESVEEMVVLRDALRAVLSLSGKPGFIDDTLLAASELVTNSVVHTNAGCRLTAWLQPEPPAVRVEVDDYSPNLPQLQVRPAWPPQGSRGLCVVEAVNARWGVSPSRVRKNAF